MWGAAESGTLRAGGVVAVGGSGGGGGGGGAVGCLADLGGRSGF